MILRNGQRQFLDQRRGNDNLLRLDQLRMLIDIDHFEVVAAVQLLLAEGPNVLNGAGGSRRAAGHEEPQDGSALPAARAARASSNALVSSCRF